MLKLLMAGDKQPENCLKKFEQHLTTEGTIFGKKFQKKVTEAKHKDNKVYAWGKPGVKTSRTQRGKPCMQLCPQRF